MSPNESEKDVVEIRVFFERKVAAAARKEKAITGKPLSKIIIEELEERYSGSKSKED